METRVSLKYFMNGCRYLALNNQKLPHVPHVFSSINKLSFFLLLGEVEVTNFGENSLKLVNSLTT